MSDESAKRERVLLGTYQLFNPRAHMLLAVRHATDMLAIGLAASGIEIPSDRRLPGFVSVGVDSPVAPLSPDEARAAFRAWVLGNALRDCTDALAQTLEYARRQLFLWSRPGDVRQDGEESWSLFTELTEDELEAAYVKFGLQYEGKPLEQQLSHLQKEYAFDLPAVTPHIESIYRLRNCLTHRAGVIGTKDVKGSPDGQLTVRWRKPRFEAIAPDGSTRRVTALTRFPTASVIKPVFGDVSKSFPLNARVELSVEEFSEICLTFVFFAIAIQQSVEERRRVRLSEAAVAGS